MTTRFFATNNAFVSYQQSFMKDQILLFSMNSSISKQNSAIRISAALCWSHSDMNLPAVIIKCFFIYIFISWFWQWFLFLVNPLYGVCLENLNDWAPAGPVGSYRTGRVTRHTLCREIAFPRTACAPSAMLRTASNFTALQHCNALYQSPAAVQPRSWWPSNMDICYRAKGRKLLSFTLGDPSASKTSITAANDLWSACILITNTIKLPYPHNTHTQAHNFHVMCFKKAENIYSITSLLNIFKWEIIKCYLMLQSF